MKPNITSLIIKDKDAEIDKLKQRVQILEKENKELYNSFMNKIKY